MIDVLKQTIPYVLGIFSAAVAAWITGYFSLKHLRKTHEYHGEELRNKVVENQAKDLENIIVPAINTLRISEMIKKPGTLSFYWYDVFLDDGYEDIPQIVKSLLYNHSLKFDSTPPNFDENIETLMKFLHNTLNSNFNVTPFFKRYAQENGRKVIINVKKLNEDIDFINKTLGKHYEQF